MDSVYKERVNCLQNLDSQHKGHRQHSLLEKERKKTEESVKHFKHLLPWKVQVEADMRYGVSEAEKRNSTEKT